MTLPQSEKHIRRAWLLSILSIPAYGVAILLGQLIHFDLHLLLPWLFPGRFGILEFGIVVILTYFLYRKKLAAAILLFVVYILDRGFTLIWLYVKEPLFIALWAALTLIWGAVFFMGIRGTVLHHRLKQ